jgi:hypothetical protein
MHSKAKAEFHYGGAVATVFFFVNQTGMLQISNVALLYIAILKSGIKKQLFFLKMFSSE